MNNFHKLSFSFVSLIYWNNQKWMLLYSFAFKKHTCVYLPYNNLTNTRLAQDVPFNTISYITTNDSIRNAHLQAHYANLKISECITSILQFRRLRLKTCNYDGSICNVVQKSFLHEWNKHVKWPFDYLYPQDSIWIIFIN
jgi:hypothetical protein